MSTPGIPFAAVVDLTAAAAPVTVTTPASGSGQLATGAGLINCITWENFAATAACKVHLRDGIDITGQIIAYLAGPGSSSGDVSPGSPGIYFERGLYQQVVAGGMLVSVTYLPLPGPL